LEFNKNLALGHLAAGFSGKGMHEEAFALIRKINADDAEITAALEDGFEKASYEGAARAVAELMTEWYGKPGKRVRAIDIADLYLRASEYDLAIDWFEKAYEEHDPNMPYIGGPDSDPLRSYPRFQDLLRKMNLPVDEKE
jgi:tetratricopeptide (TPR) repeat protein